MPEFAGFAVVLVVVLLIEAVCPENKQFIPAVRVVAGPFLYINHRKHTRIKY